MKDEKAYEIGGIYKKQGVSCCTDQAWLGVLEERE
jgi:hypothetical protein